MKLNSLLLPAIAIAGIATANAQQTTTPVGYVTQDISQGFNLLGLTLHSSPDAQGTFETVGDGATGSDLTDDQLSFTPEAGRSYIVEIVDATDTTAIGTIQVVAASDISGTTITTPDDIHLAGVAAGDSYKLRAVPTIEELFKTDGSILATGFNAGAADVLWIPNGSGGYNKYFVFIDGTVRTDAGVAAPNVPVPYADGVWIEKKGSGTVSLTVTGEVKTSRTISVITQGFNPVSLVVPAGLNLSNAGLEDELTAGFNEGAADVLWVQQANLTYKKYFRYITNTWRDTDNPGADLTALEVEAITLPSVVLIERKAAGDLEVDIEVPASYSGL